MFCGHDGGHDESMGLEKPIHCCCCTPSVTVCVGRDGLVVGISCGFLPVCLACGWLCLVSSIVFGVGTLSSAGFTV